MVDFGFHGVCLVARKIRIWPNSTRRITRKDSRHSECRWIRIIVPEKRLSIAMTVYHGNKGQGLLQVPWVALLYEIKANPHTILLDENNRIIAKDIRGKELRKNLLNS